MQTQENISKLFDRVGFDFMGQLFLTYVRKSEGAFIFRLIQSNAAEPVLGGYHYIEEDATDTEVIFKLYKAYRDFINHEIHAAFKVDGVCIFDPHVDLNHLVEDMQFMKRSTRRGSYTPQHPMQNV